MELILYQNFSPIRDKVYKNITPVGTYSAVQLTGPTDTHDIVIKMDDPDNSLMHKGSANYCKFNGAYYYIDHVEGEVSGITKIYGTMDHLMTNPDQIMELEIFADRSSLGSPRLADSMAKITSDSERITSIIGTIPADETSGAYVMVTSQSGE